jgi:voltage-dependent anion channel protein 2
LKTEYKHEKAALNCDIDLPAGGPVVHASGVLGYNGWLVGYQTSFETASSKIVKNNFALGYATKEFVMHSNVNDGQEYGGAIYQRVNDQLETGINLSWSAGSNATRFGIGCKYILSKEASVRAKVNNSSQVGLSYQQQLQDGITVTMSALLDGRNFNQGGHKVGIALDLEA